MPIETLFPDQHQPAHPQAEPALTPVRSATLSHRIRRLLESLRARSAPAEHARPGVRIARVALAFVLVCGLAAIVVGQSRRHIEGYLTDLKTGSDGVKVPAPPRLPVAPAAQQAFPPPSATELEQAAPRVIKAAGLERSAIDALIAGDLARATALYRQLSSSEPGQRVYQEALRILSEQAASR